MWDYMTDLMIGMTLADYRFVINVLWAVFAFLIMFSWVVYSLIKCCEYIIGEDIQALKWFTWNDEAYTKMESIFFSFFIACILAFLSFIPAIFWLPGTAALLTYGTVRLLRWIHRGEKLFNRAVRFMLFRN